jgi:hypothetical protein
MRSRRDGHHHAQAVTRGLAAALALLGAIATADTRADVQRIAAGGTVYRVQVEPWYGSGNPRPSGTALRLVVQQHDGTVDSTLVPGTDDATIDRDPAIEIDGCTGTPVLVWSRGDAGGYDVYVARYDGGAWSAPRPVIAQAGDDGQPDVRVGFSLIHVLWRQDMQSQARLVRASLDRLTLKQAFGPELLPIPDAGLLTDGDALDSAAATPPYFDAFFAAEVPSRPGPDPGHIVVWGVRDAPVPVDYCHWLTLPSGVSNVRNPFARYFRDRFVVSFDTAERFHYAMRYWFGWTDLRVVNLSSSVSAADARLQLEDMIRTSWY